MRAPTDRRLSFLLTLALAVGCTEGKDPERPEPAGATASGDERPARESRLHFTDVTAESGIDFQLTGGGSRPTHILEVKGGGVALIDHDADGDLDLFVANGATLRDPEAGPGCRLFENLGGLRFRDATVKSGLRLRRWSFGVAVGDYDADGLDDIYVACYGRNVLLRNAGGGRFEDVSSAAGVDCPGWSAGCAFGDLDGDGDLDIYVANYLDPQAERPPGRTRYLGVEVLKGPTGYRPLPDVLYENRGDGTFRDISEASGCRRVPDSYGLNVAICDFDGDDLQDIVVANDSHANFLFLRRPGGRFEDLGIPGGAALSADGLPQASMGLGIADVDGDGRPDIFSTNFSSDSNTLHLNLDGSLYADASRRYGLHMAGWLHVGWACGFHDFDHDGDEDLLLFNGHVFPEAADGELDAPYEQPALLFERLGERFVRVKPPAAGAWQGRRYVGRSAAFGDLDRDGDVDVVFTERGGPLRILRNDVERSAPGSWLIVELRDERAESRNRRGLGARLELSAAGTTRRRWLFTGGSFQSSSAPEAHFGVPAGVERVTLTVRWPDGFAQRLEQRLGDGATGRRLIVRRPVREN